MKELFQTYRPGNSWLHRLSLGWKYLLVMVPIFACMIGQTPLICVISLVVSILALASARIPLRPAFYIPISFWILLIFINLFHILDGRYATAIVVALTWITAIYASRILTITTEVPVIIDGITKLLAPLRKLGVNVNAISLTISLMIRSIPYLLGSVATVRNAMKARGLERSIWAQLIPVVVGAVAYAQRTGEAIAARDLLADD